MRARDENGESLDDDSRSFSSETRRARGVDGERTVRMTSSVRPITTFGFFVKELAVQRCELVPDSPQTVL